MTVHGPCAATRAAAVHLQVHQDAAKQKRRPANGHDAFADLDDEPVPRPKKPKEATDFDVVAEVLNNLRPPGPPLKQLKMKFNQVCKLPGQAPL